MTTIAWDGKHFVADRQVHYNGIADGEHTKIVKREKDGALCGGCGDAALVAAFKRWFLKGEKGDPPPLSVGTDCASSALIIYPNGTMVMHEKTGWYETINDKWAAGTGWEIAVGAMHAGASAEEAVRIAGKLDGATGNTVDILELGK